MFGIRLVCRYSTESGRSSLDSLIKIVKQRLLNIDKGRLLVVAVVVDGSKGSGTEIGTIIG
jgi:hypothetical protein